MAVVLCLHGCHQSAATFRDVTTRFMHRRAEAAGIEFAFIDAPHAHPEGGRTWTDPPLRVADIQAPIARDDASLAAACDAIAAAVAAHGASALFGFSQGAFAAVEYMRTRRDARVRAVVAVAGYAFDDALAWPAWARLLNVVHAADDVVPARCAYRPPGSVTEEHTGNRAHAVPAQAKWRDLFLDFMGEQ
jgi:predicted esterase